MTKAVNRGDKRTRRVRDRDFVKFERSRRYRDRYRCQEKKSRRERLRNLRGETVTEFVRNSKVLVDFVIRT